MTRRCLVLLVLLSALIAGRARGQELVSQPTPLTAWLDLRESRADAQTVPSWVESLEFRGKQTVTTEHRAAGRAVFRIRLTRPLAATDDLQIRLFFDDQPGGYGPEITAWTELGAEMIRSGPLGDGLGLSTSESVIFPMQTVNYLEIDAPGDGSQVRGVFLTWLSKMEARQPADFPAREPVRQAFHIPAPARPHRNDAYLFGVVTATLQADAITLPSDPASAPAFQFELERQPLVAVVSFEALGPAIDDAPQVLTNGQSAGLASFTLPDLADPAYQGMAKDADSGMSFRYTGWVRAQKVIPGTLLRGGLNTVNLLLSNQTTPVAVRNVEIQLKYSWEKFDYLLALPSADPIAP